MQVSTTRFGIVTVDDADLLTFAYGLIGMEHCRHWVLLADSQTESLGWLQSVDRPEVALAVVSPQRFIPGYRVRVSRRDIAPLELEEAGQAQVLVIVSEVEGRLVINLKAPLVIHLGPRLGRQVIAKDDHPVQHFLGGSIRLRRSA